MADITFKISGTFPMEDVLIYAKARGYQEYINTVDANGLTVSVPNTEPPERYVAQFIKNYLVKEISGVTEAKIRDEYAQKLDARIAGLYNSIKGNISVKI